MLFRSTKTVSWIASCPCVQEMSKTEFHLDFCSHINAREFANLTFRLTKSCPPFSDNSLLKYPQFSVCNIGKHYSAVDFKAPFSYWLFSNIKLSGKHCIGWFYLKFYFLSRHSERYVNSIIYNWYRNDENDLGKIKGAIMI
jgi:hypothetical protein